MKVDKSGRENETLRVNRAPAAVFDAAYVSDAPARDGNVTHKRRHAAAVHNPRVFYK
jgi:hypothetical protein